MLERTKNELFTQLGFDIINYTLLEEKAFYNAAKYSFNKFFTIFPLKHNYLVKDAYPSIIPYQAIIADIIIKTLSSKIEFNQERIILDIYPSSLNERYSILKLDDTSNIGIGDILKINNGLSYPIAISNTETNEITIENIFSTDEIELLKNTKCIITEFNPFERNHCCLISRMRICDGSNGMIMNPLNQLILGMNAVPSSQFNNTNSTGSLAFNYTLLRLFGTMQSRMTGDYETYFDDYNKQVKIIYPTMTNNPIVFEFQYGYEIKDLYTIDEENKKIVLNPQEVRLFDFINNKNYRAFSLMVGERFLQSLIMSRSQITLNNDSSFTISTSTLETMLTNIQAELERALSLTSMIPLIYG